MTIKFLQMLGSVFLLGGLISLFFAIKYYRREKVKEVKKEIEVINRETPDTSSNIDTYRKAEGLATDDDEEDNLRASFLGHAKLEDNDLMQVEDAIPEKTNEEFKEEKEDNETGKLDEDENTSNLRGFIPESEREEYENKEEISEIEEEDETVALNTGNLKVNNEKSKGEEDDRTGVLLEQAEF